MRIADQKHLAEGAPAVGQQSVADLFDAVVDRVDERDAAQQPIPIFQQTLAKHVAHQKARAQDGQHRQNDAQTGNMDAEQIVRMPRGGQQQQRLVEDADDETQHPQGDHQRHQHQQAGQQVFLHECTPAAGQDAQPDGSHGAAGLFLKSVA